MNGRHLGTRLTELIDQGWSVHLFRYGEQYRVRVSRSLYPGGEAVFTESGETLDEAVDRLAKRLPETKR